MDGMEAVLRDIIFHVSVQDQHIANGSPCSAFRILFDEAMLL